MNNILIMSISNWFTVVVIILAVFFCLNGTIKALVDIYKVLKEIFRKRK